MLGQLHAGLSSAHGSDSHDFSWIFKDFQRFSSRTCCQVRHRDPERFPNHCGMPALGLEDEYEMCEYLQEPQK